LARSAGQIGLGRSTVRFRPTARCHAVSNAHAHHFNPRSARIHKPWNLSWRGAQLHHQASAPRRCISIDATEGSWCSRHEGRIRTHHWCRSDRNPRPHHQRHRRSRWRAGRGVGRARLVHPIQSPPVRRSFVRSRREVSSSNRIQGRDLLTSPDTAVRAAARSACSGGAGVGKDRVSSGMITTGLRRHHAATRVRPALRRAPAEAGTTWMRSQYSARSGVISPEPRALVSWPDRTKRRPARSPPSSA